MQNNVNTNDQPNGKKEFKLKLDLKDLKRKFFKNFEDIGDERKAKQEIIKALNTKQVQWQASRQENERLKKQLEDMKKQKEEQEEFYKYIIEKYQKDLQNAMNDAHQQEELKVQAKSDYNKLLEEKNNEISNLKKQYEETIKLQDNTYKKLIDEYKMHNELLQQENNLLQPQNDEKIKNIQEENDKLKNDYDELFKQKNDEMKKIRNNYYNELSVVNKLLKESNEKNRKTNQILDETEKLLKKIENENEKLKKDNHLLKVNNELVETMNKQNTQQNIQLFKQNYELGFKIARIEDNEKAKRKNMKIVKANNLNIFAKKNNQVKYIQDNTKCHKNVPNSKYDFSVNMLNSKQNIKNNQQISWKDYASKNFNKLLSMPVEENIKIAKLFQENKEWLNRLEKNTQQADEIRRRKYTNRQMYYNNIPFGTINVNGLKYQNYFK